MSIALNAVSRTSMGKRAKDVLAAGRIPAVMYGRGIESKSIEISASEFLRVYRQSGTSSIIDVTLNGETVKALVQEVQINPLTMKPQHIDLRQIRMDQELTVDVPLVFTGEAPAVKGLAGTFVHPITTLKVTCLPKDLPHEIAVDIAVLKTFEDVITVADITLPAGVTVAEDPTITVATVAAPLTDEQLKRMEDEAKMDVSAIKTEAEEKKEAEEAKKAEETQAAS